MKTNIHFRTYLAHFFLERKNISHKSCRETRNTHFTFNNFFFVENRAVYEIMWKKFVEWGRSQMTIWRIQHAHCMLDT